VIRGRGAVYIGHYNQTNKNTKHSSRLNDPLLTTCSKYMILNEREQKGI